MAEEERRSIGEFFPVYEAARISAVAPALRLLLHGYFFVDFGRRQIEGFESEASPGSIRGRWNAAIRDDVVLPLLPAVLHDAFEAQILSSDQLASIVEAFRSSGFGWKYAKAIASVNGLGRVLESGRSSSSARWRIFPSKTTLRPLPPPTPGGS